MGSEMCIRDRYDELLPMARPMVRLLGLYRETLQPEKRGPLL